ncbi:MAG TPA: hypothetical protein PK014_07555 [Thermoanaerobaculia bacterium]|nr:hypothetical protein [Thermoanaerobaculia bacterium]HUM29897.1 hypothetical protein [Thermoanaerobaculia bacterium]HXK68236.1 hypothetical protein [Thermoanaerobaculia bacterium]
MNTDRDRENLFPGLKLPEPPPDLKQRVMKSVIQTWENTAAETVWDRIFFSRPLRVAWVSTFLLLVAGHLFMTYGPSQRTARTEPSQRASFINQDLLEIASLPAIDLRHLPSLNEFQSPGEERSMTGGPTMTAIPKEEPRS